MAKPFSVRLTTEERRELEDLAESFDCFSGRGNTQDKPSIGVMLKRIAAGELVISEIDEEESTEATKMAVLAEDASEDDDEDSASAAVTTLPACDDEIEQSAPEVVANEPSLARSKSQTKKAKYCDRTGLWLASTHTLVNEVTPPHHGLTAQSTPAFVPVSPPVQTPTPAPISPRPYSELTRTRIWKCHKIEFPAFRIGLTGATRSGKSTAIHNFLYHALRFKWEKVILLDGKGSELCFYEGLSGITYWGPEDTEEWANELATIIEGYSARFAELAAEGLREAPYGKPRYLVVVDEVQHGVRDEAIGNIKKAITLALQIMSEKSGALGDCMLLSSQREEGNIPKAIRHNFNADLQMLGRGYFVFNASGLPSIRGRTEQVSPQDVIAGLKDADPMPLTLECFAEILGADPVEPGKARATLYVGEPGSGLTYHLENHPRRKWRRVIYVDFSIGHKAALEQLIEKCHAMVPSGAKIHELDTLAAQALSSEATLLLIDNVSRATPKAKHSIEKLISCSGEAALAMNHPRSKKEMETMAAFFERCHVEEIGPLSAARCELLADEWLRDGVANRQAMIKHIVERANGNPRRLVRLCDRVQRGGLEELRGIRDTPRQKQYVNLSILLVIPIFWIAYTLRDSVDHWLLGAGSVFVYILARSLINKMFFEIFK